MCRMDPGRQLQNANKLHVKGGSPEEKRKHRIFFLKASLREGYNKNKKDQAGKKSKKNVASFCAAPAAAATHNLQGRS